MKGVSGLITFVLTIGIIVTTLTVVWLAGKPVIEKSQESALVSESNNILASLDSTIKDVIYGKAGSSRVLTLSISGGEYFVRNDDNSIEFSLDTLETLVEPSGQIRTGNQYKAGSRDSKAYQTTVSGVDSLVLENSNIFFAIRSIPTSANIYTNNLTVLMRNKKLNLNLTPIDTSVLINDVSTSSSGTGYTYFIDNGTRYGYSQVVAHIVSGSIEYDVYYTLYSNADFVDVQIRNSTVARNVTFNLETLLSSGSIGTGTNYVTYYNSTLSTGVYNRGSNLISATNSGNKLIIKQNYEGNGIWKIFTKSPESTITSANVDDITKWSGSFGYGINKEPKYYSWLYYPIINFTRNETLGKGSYKIYIYNNGTSNGKAQIEISVI